VLKAKKEKRQKEVPARRPAGGNSKAELTKVRERLDTVTARMEKAESRIAAIDALFCQPDYYTRTSGDEVRALEGERARCQDDVADSLAEWEKLEATIAKLDQEPPFTRSAGP